MRRLAAISLAALIGWAGAASAQADQKTEQKDPSTLDTVSGHIKSGAQQIGEGAQRVGQTIKEGAVNTWESVKAGASAAAEKFQDGKSAPKKSETSGGSDEAAH